MHGTKTARASPSGIAFAHHRPHQRRCHRRRRLRSLPPLSRRHRHPQAPPSEKLSLFRLEITESGCSYLDAPYGNDGGRVPDTRRIQFFRAELAELARAIADGANVRAFHARSLLDNFEWADGYTERYGLTYVDFRDQKRTVKDSGLCYGNLAANNRLGPSS